MHHHKFFKFALFLCVAAGARAQDWDPAANLAETIAASGRWKLSFEWRERYESRTGTNFGKDPGIDTVLGRTRLGLTYSPEKWLKFSGMVQDSRAPLYGPNAPTTVRDPADLHEAYIELFPGYKRGLGMTAGRMMLNYGDGRLIGTPQWGNLARTYDQARVLMRLPLAQLDFLLVSPVKIRAGEWNRPVLGERIWGFYGTIPKAYAKNQLETYLLRHDQNRQGGFTGGTTAAGTDRLGVNTAGFRLSGPAGDGSKYTLEAAGQWGTVGPADHRATAWAGTLSHRFNIARRSLDLSSEYKFASGTANPADAHRVGTFDQLSAANHDKFGHEDLFGWRNLHNVRSLATFELTKSLALNVMYNSYWLVCLKDSLYNSSGKSILRSPNGTAGRYVGQEADLFATYKYGHMLWGGGYGHFFAGEFVRNAGKGVGPVYLYLFHTYSF